MKKQPVYLFIRGGAPAPASAPRLPPTYWCKLLALSTIKETRTPEWETSLMRIIK
jgi:hypothetical protein